MVMQTLIVGLGRSGRSLHLPVLLRARASEASRHLFADRPVVTFDPCGPDAAPPGTVLAGSLAQAADVTDPGRTVVHLCTPPTVRVEVLTQLARLGFRKILVEKPLAVDEYDLAEIARLRRNWGLAVTVVAPWRASVLTQRLQEVLAGGAMGSLRVISVVQRKPRFTRSLADTGHPSVFDVEMPHAVGVAMALAGSARVRDATWSDMRFGDVVVPRMGTAWLCLDHDTGVRTDLFSDLTSPTRERRITLELEGGTLVGHYASSEDDNTAQLSATVDGRRRRAVFRDDALSTFMLRTYERFAASGSGGDEPRLDAEVVRVLAEAKRRCGRRGCAAPRRLAVGGQAAGGLDARTRHDANGSDSATTVRAAPVARANRGTPGPAIRFAGIGDEAGMGLQDQLGSLARLGWASIELRTVNGTVVADLDNEAFARLAGTLQSQGLAVACVASQIGNWARPISGDFDKDLDELAVLARRCLALGTRYIRVMSYPNDGLPEQEWGRRVVGRMRRLAGQAEQAGLVLVHENCTGWAGTAAERMLDLLDRVGSPALRLLFDTGNGVAYGYEAYDLLTQIVDHVAHVHVKDAEGSPAHPRYTLPGAGQARVADCLRLLLDRGYTGTWSIEPHLALQPHLAARRPGRGNGGTNIGRGNGDSFVASGQALERLVREQLLPTFPGWTTGRGGMVKRSDR